MRKETGVRQPGKKEGLSGRLSERGNSFRKGRGNPTKSRFPSKQRGEPGGKGARQGDGIGKKRKVKNTSRVHGEGCLNSSKQRVRTPAHRREFRKKNKKKTKTGVAALEVRLFFQAEEEKTLCKGSSIKEKRGTRVLAKRGRAEPRGKSY